MIRLIVYFFLLLGVVLTTIILYPVSRLIGLFSVHGRDVFCQWYAVTWCHAARTVSGNKVIYKGLENLPTDGRTVVYIGNHRSNFDIVEMYPVVPGLTGFVAKSEMSKWPIFNLWLPAINALYMNRTNNREGLKTILAGIKKVESGISMVIYPEGTRSKEEGKLLPFHAGSFKLATKPGVDIIPVASSNSSALLEDNFPHLKAVPTVMEFGEPIHTKGLSKEELEELPEKVRDIIYDMVIRNSKEIGVLPESFVRED